MKKNQTDFKEQKKPKRIVLTKVNPQMTEEDIFESLMLAFRKQGITVKND